MKPHKKEIALTIKPHPTYLHLQANGHEQKVPYNDITNSFMHYVNINKIPPQIQETFSHLTVEVIKSEHEKYVVDLKSENEHQLNLDPDISVYHNEKIKHYNETKYDFIKFKKKERTKKMVNVINEVRGHRSENSKVVYEGRSKKCQRYMVLCRSREGKDDGSFDMTGQVSKTLKELKMTGCSQKKQSADRNNKDVNNSALNGEFMAPKSVIGVDLLDAELYGNFNNSNVIGRSFSLPHISDVKAEESLVYLTIFLYVTDRVYCIIRQGEENGTHSKGYMIKHTLPKSIDGYLENIKNNYTLLGYKVKKDIGNELNVKKPAIKDISSRIHESANLDVAKRSLSYEKNVKAPQRNTLRSASNMQMNKNHTVLQPPYSMSEFQMANRRPPQTSNHGQHEIPYGYRNNHKHSRQVGDMAFNPRHSTEKFISNNFGMDKTFDHNRHMQRPGDISHKSYTNLHKSAEHKDGNRPLIPPYAHRTPEIMNLRPPNAMQQAMRNRHNFNQHGLNSRMPPPRQQPPPNIPVNQNKFQQSNAYNNINNLKPSYSVNPSALFEDPRNKINPSHISNVHMKVKSPKPDEETKKHRKDESQDMPDFF